MPAAIVATSGWQGGAPAGPPLGPSCLDTTTTNVSPPQELLSRGRQGRPAAYLFDGLCGSHRTESSANLRQAWGPEPSERSEPREWAPSVGEVEHRER